MEKSEILICDCNSTEHQIVIHYDEEDNIVYCHIHLSKRPFFKRVWGALKYIFGYSCRFGHWDEFLFGEEHIEKLEELTRLLSKNKNKNKN